MKAMALVLVIAIGFCSTAARAQDDVAEVPNKRITVAPQQEYFLIGAKPDATPPESGYGLLLVLPGGDGSAEFNPFVRRIWENALPEGFLVAQLISVPSKNPNQVVWPTAKSKDRKQTFTTESFIQAVVDDVTSKHSVDESRVYALAWSSGGPAVYAAALSEKSPLNGAFIAMSVFIPGNLPPVRNAKDRSFYLLQSPQDQVTRFMFAERAEKALSNVGANVKLTTYEGGHGWFGDVFGNIRAGVEWLDQHRPVKDSSDSTEGAQKDDVSDASDGSSQEKR